MSIIDKIKKIFKKSDHLEATPSILKLKSIKNDDEIIDRIEQDTQKRIEEKEAAEKRLTEYLAAENARRKEIEQKLYDELNEKERIKEEERKARKESEIAQQRAKQKQDEKIQKITPEQRREEQEKAQKRREEERRKAQQKAEERRLAQIALEQKRKEEEKKLEQQRAEQKRLDEIRIQERKKIEKERLRQIHELETNNETFREYLIEAEKFRREFGKDIKCCIGGEWGHEVELYVHRGQTYCEKHIPPELHRENEHKVRAGLHGAAQNFIKK